ncbi:signal peptide peptidase SppA [Saccharophagus degradans]|uniref:signal peptide peptidase SppA n=1 Tax=Saccharophagus degradans TaxID=86304 RepID=UPI001C08B901|nr:signal peptide peptidase SppA [Saccharophagus degradans]MBU2984474.1 signal peptide peptidase SppA [Saccharophagus degradans]
MKFIRGLWRGISALRNFIFNILFLIIFISILVAMFSSPFAKIENGTALWLAPSGDLVDQLTYDPSPLALLDSSNRPNETLVSDLITAIDRAKTDSRISALVLNLNHLTGGGVSKLTEVGDAILRFKEGGKEVVAFGDNLSQQQYYLATYADHIYLNDLGAVFVTGYGIYRNYWAEAADKLKLKFHVFRVGDYKDAIEPFVRNSMSDASREHNGRWLNELWGLYTSQVEAQRELPVGAVNEYITSLPKALPNYSGTAAEFARDAGLVDEVVSRVKLREIFIAKYGEGKEKGQPNGVTMEHYLADTFTPNLNMHDNIGLIVASGTIYDGRHPEGTIGGDSMADLLREAQKDNSLKALVIRVDSGGGSAFASEVIRQEISNLKAKGIPIYISMGSLAASGGYWIATAADEIWATPATLTGSIGVWGLYPNLTDSLDALGIHTDGIGTTELADVFRTDRPLSNAAEKVLQSGVDNIYSRFLSIVAEARGISVEQVNEIAQGRVWSGTTAKELGLVDELGGLNDVIKAAAERQQLSDYRVKLIAQPLSAKEQFLRALTQNAKALTSNIENTLLDNAPAIKLFKDLNQQSLFEPLAIQGNKQELNVLAQCVACITP